MLGNKNAIATIAVKDLNQARKFYEGTLGLTPIDTKESEAVVYRSGDSSVLVYRSQYAGTNKATAVTWSAGDALEDIVRALEAKGVAFEHYDMPGGTLQGDVHVFGTHHVAWFKDPDGNIISLNNE